MSKTLNDIIAEQIREHRLAKGMSKAGLSRALGINEHSTHVIAWENARQMPGAYFLCQLADVFGCSVDELLGRK